MTHELPRKDLMKLQRNRCYLCGEPFVQHARGVPDRRTLNRRGRKTIDHVRPRSQGHTRENNKLYAHGACNERKGDRDPRPCELLFLEAINTLSRSAA